MPGPLAAVIIGVTLNEAFRLLAPAFANEGVLLVQIPALHEEGIAEALHMPDFSAIADVAVLKLAVVLAIVASIETLLCTEAADRIDPFRRRSDADRELRAQGIGNMLCGLVGGLPMTAVIVRTSANVQSGGRTRMASFVHGVLLLLSVVAIPGLLSRIPLAALAAILLHVGYKLAPWQLFLRMYKLGHDQFLPFVITVVAIVFTDLLSGVAIGMAAGAFFILRANAKTPFFMTLREDSGGARRRIRIRLSENVTFLNKAAFSKVLHELPDGSRVVLDASEARWVDRDVLEMIHEFAETAHYRGIDVELVDVPPVDAGAGTLAERTPIVTTAADVRRADAGPRR
jgi:MFS superfamily sulfate permease-like transporter